MRCIFKAFSKSVQIDFLDSWVGWVTNFTYVFSLRCKIQTSSLETSIRLFAKIDAMSLVFLWFRVLAFRFHGGSLYSYKAPVLLAFQQIITFLDIPGTLYQDIRNIEHSISLRQEVSAWSIQPFSKYSSDDSSPPFTVNSTMLGQLGSRNVQSVYGIGLTIALLLCSILPVAPQVFPKTYTVTTLAGSIGSVNDTNGTPRQRANCISSSPSSL